MLTVTLTWAKQNVGARGYAKPIQVCTGRTGAIQVEPSRAGTVTGSAEPAQVHCQYRGRAVPVQVQGRAEP